MIRLNSRFSTSFEELLKSFVLEALYYLMSVTSNYSGCKHGVRPACFKRFWEMPCADPHAWCCGSWGLKTSGYRIMPHLA